MGIGGEGFDLDLAAASLGADGGDLQIMMGQLLGKLSVLKDRFRVERSGGLFRKNGAIRNVSITIGATEFAATLEGTAPEFRIGRVSGGVRIRTERTDAVGWSKSLIEALQVEATHSAEARLALRGDRDRRTVTIESGAELPADLPKDAGTRLAELEAGLFTSDLSVNEFLLVKDAGFHPLGFVMGSSIYHIGLQTRRWGQSQELDKLTSAMYEARELAMNRMEEEAAELGADGVVGVRLDVNYYEFGSDTAEFIAMGTAIKAEDGTNYRNREGKPFTSDLSGQAFWTLRRVGHVPLGLVMGTCVYHIAHRGPAQSLSQLGRNVELPNYTQALYSARELAMTRMQDEANRLGTSGIVEVKLIEKSHTWGSHTIEFLALGTAVAAAEGAAGLTSPEMIISLDS